jgi:hypothetical protein
MHKLQGKLVNEKTLFYGLNIDPYYFCGIGFSTPLPPYELMLDILRNFMSHADFRTMLRFQV